MESVSAGLSVGKPMEGWLSLTAPCPCSAYATSTLWAWYGQALEKSWQVEALEPPTCKQHFED